uniref:Uncharacterized protein n=1 Tax=Sophora flavescens TaxID=49840 RepID=A0A4Y5UZ50_SOPFL|nr:hypothetical protein FPI08_mgp15 [Sophora flavescens]QDD68270.1 hypothetical protein [Sophora flavescens]
MDFPTNGCLLLVAIISFVQSEASGAIVPFLLLALIDIVCGSSGSGTSYIYEINDLIRERAYPILAREWTNSFIQCILIENLCRRSAFSSLRSRGELLVRSLSDLD